MSGKEMVQVTLLLPAPMVGKPAAFQVRQQHFEPIPLLPLIRQSAMETAKARAVRLYSDLVAAFHSGSLHSDDLE